MAVGVMKRTPAAGRQRCGGADLAGQPGPWSSGSITQLAGGRVQGGAEGLVGGVREHVSGCGGVAGGSGSGCGSGGLGAGAGCGVAGGMESLEACPWRRRDAWVDQVVSGWDIDLVLMTVPLNGVGVVSKECGRAWPGRALLRCGEQHIWSVPRLGAGRGR